MNVSLCLVYEAGLCSSYRAYKNYTYEKRAAGYRMFNIIIVPNTSTSASN